ncbi:hypothetical protein HK096_002122, partial [Nowakowskiella sp. JEL0078]
NVMPVLHNLGMSDRYFDDLGNLDWVWKKTNTESVGELVVAFFKYFSSEFPIIHGVASVKSGKVLSKDDKGWTKDRHVVSDK